ncbi:MAG: DUF4981 domain-containing protein [Clostridia bacterium]|nr:DUF4981 domain-containing protein [Clostridia bacterium]
MTTCISFWRFFFSLPVPRILVTIRNRHFDNPEGARHMPSRIFPGRPERPDWNRIECLERNRYPRHAYLVHFPDQLTCEQAQADNRRYLSPYVLMLTGAWDYKWVDSILQLPENIFSYRSGFDRIQVPASSQALARTQSQSDGWPFVLDPPQVPETLPVAVYHRSLELPKNWNTCRKKLVLQGVLAACHVVLNGKLVGYVQDGRQLNEFDVTSRLHDGANELFILVYPYHTASYLDGHCLANRAGLAGDLYLEATPALSVFDLSVHTRLDLLTKQWSLAVQASVLTFKVTQELPQVRFTLVHDGRVILEQVVKPEKIQLDQAGFDAKVQQAGQARLHVDCPDVTAWSDEQPELYDLFVTCLDANGRDASTVHQTVGFCERTVRDGLLHLNHQPVFLSLADYNPLDQQTGLLRPLSGLARELSLLRQHFNAIRLLGGPMDPIFFDLCNHLGLLVLVSPPAQPVREWQTAAEKEGELPWLGEPWLAIWKDRLHSQIVLLKNQPSVLAWTPISQPFGTDPALAVLVKELDPTRPLVQLAETRENLAMSNHDTSPGPVIRILVPDNSLLGGGTHQFLQPLTDAALRSQVSGLVLGSWQDVFGQIQSSQVRAQSVALAAIRQANRPAELRPLDLQAGHFRVTNRMRIQSLDLFRLHWQIVASGRLVLAGEIDFPPVLPGETADLSIPYANVERPQDLACHLQLTVHQIDANLWSPDDFIVSTDSYRLDLQTPERDPFLKQLLPAIASGRNRLRLEQDRHLLVVSGHRFWLVFNRITAQIESWRCKDHEYLAFVQMNSQLAPSALVFWRPLLKQDQAWAQDWNQLGLSELEQMVDQVEADCDGETASIVAHCRFGPAGAKTWLAARLRYTIHESGKIEINVSLPCENQAQLAELPRVGLRFLLRRQYERIIWSGQGPGPSWPGLRGMTYDGQFEQSLSDLMPDWHHPFQPELPHAQTSWVAIADATGSGLLFESNQPFSFCASDHLSDSGLPQSHEARAAYQNLIDWKIDWYYKPSGGQPGQKLDRENFSGTQNTAEFYVTLTPVTGL